jgi:hypothetical protein
MIPIARLFELTESYQIYCDMDGVLTYFNGSARKIGYDGPLPAPKGPDREKLWSMVLEDPEKFWGDMPWLPGGKRIWKTIEPFKPVLLTSVASDMNSKLGVEGKKGKQRWIKRELGNEYLNTALIVSSGTKDKYVSQNSILIDDDKDNIDSWISAGGIGILHKDPDKTIEQIKKLMDVEITENRYDYIK